MGMGVRKIAQYKMNMDVTLPIITRLQFVQK
jgi:hypothetical protein